ncbi:uncharacterized protein LACBIDRAFT_330706 [Laccaria bicolor S238N-H82]|uniref:Predicted protein n=1 Tax=Laccaria bicolor (strain S238N-H82 / ATCC MYA-4686) TaxID=486041 RepID=B0DM65_LACBS|nr:uncharacterized protein LACBIDRAFT_330706 [Laccaria bicolor S238N-H82]EDR04228.1 predicted protein [Laccaria bicolor S238N-H82]|eukprot:XP_001885119.1 predicted protein [Laccaria bicolor S238N-H82]
MTRTTWTTDNQREWLEQCKAAFIEAKQKGTAALKEFYPGTFALFQEKWPMDPVTSDKVTAAGSTELATKIKRDKNDKACHSPILKIKPKPKMLQEWQAYHALTYTKQWKPYVDNEWETYKKEWEAVNPNEKKPPKSRLQIMVEFINTFHSSTDSYQILWIPAGIQEFWRIPGILEDSRNSGGFQEFQRNLTGICRNLTGIGRKSHYLSYKSE